MDTRNLFAVEGAEVFVFVADKLDRSEGLKLRKLS